MEINDDEEMNMMELARLAGAIAGLGEWEAQALLRELCEPVQDETGNELQIRRVLVGVVFTRLCEVNGSEAMRMYHEGEIGQGFINSDDELLAYGMNSWVAADPEGAREWVEGLIGETDHLALRGGTEEEMTGMTALLKSEDFLEAYLRGMARHDAEGLRSRMGELQHDELREAMEIKAFEATVRYEENAENLLALMEEHGDQKAGEARREAIQKLATLDAGRAAEWVETQPAGAEKDRYVTMVATEWMKEDPATGAEWYMQQDMHEGNQESNRMQQIVWKWGQKDYGAAEEWLQDQPNEPERDISESSLAQLASQRRDWVKAMEWVADISDERIQGTALQNVLKQGWDRRENAINPDLAGAAEAAGFGDEILSYGER